MRELIWYAVGAVAFALGLMACTYILFDLLGQLRGNSASYGMECPTCGGIIQYKPGMGGECPNCKTYIG